MDIYKATETAYKNGYDKGFKESLALSDTQFVEGCACVSNAKVFGLRESIRRAKYPLSADISKPTSELTEGIKSLARSAAGSGHDQWLTGVIVQFDLRFSNKAWVEMERYHFIDFISSQSTMHRITNFDLDKSYNSHVDPRIVDIMKEKVRKYNDYIYYSEQGTEEWVQSTAEKEKLYLDILYSNPAGFMLTAGITTNYRQLKTIYRQRKLHRLPEWREFCRWIRTLPHSELITGEYVTANAK